MNKTFSIYLDVVRFGAAVLVYLYHSNQRWLSSSILPLSSYGHSAVIVFFILSGYVIAYITATKEFCWEDYAASRLARVYSVVLPALLLCALLDAWGRHLYAVPYAGYPFDNLMLRLGASLLMLNEIWWVSITNLSNVPFWSISFEFWYYALFGLFVFLPRRWRVGGVTILLLILGPKIALMMIMWLMGVALYHWDYLKKLSGFSAFLLGIGSTVGIVAVHLLGTLDLLHHEFWNYIGADWQRELTFAKFLPGDLLLGALVFLHFAALRVLAPAWMAWLRNIERPVRWMASYTFTLYLLHQPLFLFWGAMLRGNPHSPFTWWIVSGLVAFSVLSVGQITEKRREPMRLWLRKVLLRLTKFRLKST